MTAKLYHGNCLDIISVFAALGIETEEKRLKARHGMGSVYDNCDDATARIEKRIIPQERENMNATLKAPFPWFGGKSKVSGLVWQRFGHVKNYVEPFFGSGAVLLGKPSQFDCIETINDKDGFVANFWRSLAMDPELVWHYADEPVNECDLHAKHLWLLQHSGKLPEKLMADPDFYDAKIAGWWVWGICSWIGTAGWCSGNGPWQNIDGILTKVKPNSGQGINRQRPDLGNRGINRNLPHLGTAGPLTDLADRLRHVRVCCGDWGRVCGFSPTSYLGLTGVFLDPPYDLSLRDAGCYNIDKQGLSAKVRKWCIENQDNPKMRIALCGYQGEHDLPGWEVVSWKAKGGYGNQCEARGRENASKEMIWFSPHCLNPQA